MEMFEGRAVELKELGSVNQFIFLPWVGGREAKMLVIMSVQS